MRDSALLRAQSAGLGFGAALMLAGCGAPPAVSTSGHGANQGGLSSIDGANVALASFHNSAFPYHGLIPNYQESGKSRPFLDVDDNGRLGHSSPRGGLLWEDQTYNDRTVLLAAPQSFDPNQSGVIIVFFHGNSATLSNATSSPATWSLNAGTPASANLTITSSAGTTVYTGTQSLNAGIQSFTWNGKGNNGQTWPDGTYTLSINAAGANGQAVNVSSQVQGVVSCVNTSANPPTLTVSGQTVQLSQITSISH